MKIFSFILIFITSTSFNYANKSFIILSQDDWNDQLVEMNEPAISIPQLNGSWKYSYNKWYCFLKNQISVEKAEIDYNGWHEIPKIQVNQEDGLGLSFDLDPDVEWNSDQIINDWNNLLSESDYVCIFAAYLQTNENIKMLYIEKIKFNGNYWDRSDEIFKLEEDTEIED